MRKKEEEPSFIEISELDFDADKVIKSLKKERIGAIGIFIGIIRDFTEIEGKSDQKER
jgi:molybdopterin synthase catalytic subunit